MNKADLGNLSEKPKDYPILPQKRKNEAIKNRFQTIIFSLGMSEKEFYKKIGISKQQWYVLSWGLWDPPFERKLEIAQLLKTDTGLIWGGSHA